MPERKYNFSAGPAMMPAEVLQVAAEEMGDWGSTGTGVMEMSHRGKDFGSIIEEAEIDLRQLMQVPESHKILFLQGGATGQFWAIPNNLARKNVADYVVTGEWGEKAVAEGQKVLGDNLKTAAKSETYTYVPDPYEWKLSPSPGYVHVTPNETINGVAYRDIPALNCPLVADMSSTILSEPIAVENFGVIYAGAQKNIGPAGLTVVIAREDLLDQARPEIPAVCHWAEQAKKDSMINTPNTYAIYMAGLVFKWLKKSGGLEFMSEVNTDKANRLYDAIDQSVMYKNPVQPEFRSKMNVPFILNASGLEKTFQQEAAQEGMVELAGHRSVGGLRASIYNAMPVAGVNKLIDFMKDFEERHETAIEG